MLSMHQLNSSRYMSDDDDDDVQEAAAEIKQALQLADNASGGAAHDEIEGEGIPSDMDEDSMPDDSDADDALAQGVHEETFPTKAASPTTDGHFDGGGHDNDDYGDEEFEGEVAVTEKSDESKKARNREDLDDTYGEEGFDDLPDDPPTLTLSRRNSSASLAASPRLVALSQSAGNASKQPDSAAVTLESQAKPLSPEVRASMTIDFWGRRQ